MDAVKPSVLVQWGGREVPLLIDANAMIEYRDTFGVSLEADFGEMMQITVQAIRARETGENPPDPTTQGSTRLMELFTRFLWASSLFWADPSPDLQTKCEGLTPLTLRQIRRDLPPVGSDEYAELNIAALRVLQKALGIQPPKPGEERPTTAANRTPQSKKSTGKKRGGLAVVASA